MSEPDVVADTDPEVAFAALADETRVAILQALWNPADDWSPREPTSFSALREAVGMRDSGQFNYHLDKLTDRFVRKTDDGYELTLAGRHVVGAIRAGSYSAAAGVEPLTLDDPCPSCGGDMVFTYEHERASIACESCNMQLGFWVPPGVFEGVDRESMPPVASRYLRASVRKMTEGFCWFCEGEMATDLVPVADLVPETTDEVALDDRLPLARLRCTRCGESVTIDLGTAMMETPVVVEFLHGHGVDVAGEDWWHHNVLDPDRVHFLDDGEARACVHFEAGGETLRVHVDGDLAVVATERTRD